MLLFLQPSYLTENCKLQNLLWIRTKQRHDFRSNLLGKLRKPSLKLITIHNHPTIDRYLNINNIEKWPNKHYRWKKKLSLEIILMIHIKWNDEKFRLLLILEWHCVLNISPRLWILFDRLQAFSVSLWNKSAKSSASKNLKYDLRSSFHMKRCQHVW